MVLAHRYMADYSGSPLYICKEDVYSCKIRSFESATKRLALTTINTNVGEYFGMGVVLNTVTKNICSNRKGA